MAEREKLYIFHLFRKDGTSLFLHPFLSTDKLVIKLERAVIEGRYGNEPRVEALTMFRNELYRRIEAGVKSWISEIRFIPKFLISSGIFLAAYFAMAFVIRDPLPVLDEAAIGLGAAIVTYLLLGRRYLTSERATKKRLSLRIIVDKIIFRESKFVRQVESALHRNETDRLEEVIKQIIEPSKQEFGDPFKEEAGQFIQLLENRFNFKRFKKEEKILKKFIKNRTYGEEMNYIKKRMKSRNLDFPLYAVYKCFKKTVSNSKIKDR